MTKEEFIQYEKDSKDSIDLKRIYIDIAGDIVTGVLLSQIIFYYLPDDKGKTKLRVMHDNELWLAKTREEWWEECRISPKQFDRSIKILEDKQLVTTKTIKFNGSPVKHIRLNLDILTEQIELFDKMKNDKNINYKKWIKSNSSNLPNKENGFLPKGKIEIDQTENSKENRFLPKVKNEKNADEKATLPKEENGFLPKGKIEIDQKANSITEITTETTNRDYLLPDSTSLSSRSSDNKLVTRSKRSLWKSSLWCSDTKIDNLNTDNTPKDTVCILDNNKRDISLNKALDIEHIKPEISLKVPVIEPEIGFKKLDRETAIEPVNKPVLSTVTMLEDKTGKILNNNLNKPEKDTNSVSDTPDNALSESFDFDDDLFELDDELFESEKHEAINAMPNPDDAPNASLETSHSDPDKEPETSLNAPEREPERNVIMPDADLIELENEPAGMDAEQTLQNNTDLHECPFVEDTSNFTSAAEKTDCDTDSHEFHALDKADVNKAQGNQNADSNADLMLHHTTTEQGFESVPEGEEVNYGYGNWNDYSLEETDDDGTIISSGQFVQDCDAFEDFDGDWKMLEEYGFTVIDEENSTKAQVNAQNASEKDCKDSCDAFLSDLSDDVVKILAKDELSDADIKILEEAGFSVVGELDNTMQPDTKNVPEKHIDSTEHELVRMLEEAFNAKVIDDVESDIDSVLIVPEKHADSTEQDFVRMLEEAFNAKVIDDAESDVDTASDMPEKHVDNTEQELVKMLENAFNAKVVDDTENDIASVVNGTEKREKLHDVRLTDELDALPESLLSEPEKMLDADKPDEVLVAKVGRNLNEPEKVRIVDHNKLKKVPIDETDSKPDEVRKSKVISLADRRYQKSLRQAEKLTENALDRRKSQIAFVNRHTNALQKCFSCKDTDSLTTAVGKEKVTGISGFGELELAVNAGIRKQWKTVRGSPHVKANCIEIFKNLFAMSRQKHRKMTFACEGGILK
ncbi:MAG: hypothetical protein ACFWT2_12415 [Thermoanaerobacterium thermosaccharolyticum]|jgi:hypothetical protein